MAIQKNAADLIGGIFDSGAASDAAEELRKLGIAPEYFGGDYVDPSYSGDFNPIMYDDPEAAQYQLIAEDPRLKGVQMDALQRLIDQGSGAADIGRQANQAMALDEANQLARAREGAIRMDAERKGQGGAGTDMIMRAQSAQMGANRAKSGTLSALHDAALEKLAAHGNAINAASGIRGQDFRANSANSDIVNRFNMANTAAKNAARMGNVDLKNRAGVRNLDARQGNNNAVAGTRNASIDRRDRISNQKHGATMDRFAIENDLREKYNRGLGQSVSGGVGLGMDALGAVSAGATGGWGGAAKSVAKQGRQQYAGAGEQTNPYEDDWLTGMA